MNQTVFSLFLATITRRFSGRMLTYKGQGQRVQFPVVKGSQGPLSGQNNYRSLDLTIISFFRTVSWITDKLSRLCTDGTVLERWPTKRKIQGSIPGWNSRSRICRWDFGGWNSRHSWPCYHIRLRQHIHMLFELNALHCLRIDNLIGKAWPNHKLIVWLKDTVLPQDTEITRSRMNASCSLSHSKSSALFSFLYVECGAERSLFAVSL